MDNRIAFQMSQVKYLKGGGLPPDWEVKRNENAELKKGKIGKPGFPVFFLGPPRQSNTREANLKNKPII